MKSKDTVGAFTVNVDSALIRWCHHGFAVDSCYGQWLSEKDLKTLGEAIEEALVERRRRIGRSES